MLSDRLTTTKNIKIKCEENSNIGKVIDLLRRLLMSYF
jgi:hypothetical protein